MWRKFLSRKFLLAVAVFVLGIVQTAAPGALNGFDWKIVAPILAFIFGEAGYDIIKAYIEWTQPKA